MQEVLKITKREVQEVLAPYWESELPALEWVGEFLDELPKEGHLSTEQVYDLILGVGNQEELEEYLKPTANKILQALVAKIFSLPEEQECQVCFVSICQSFLTGSDALLPLFTLENFTRIVRDRETIMALGKLWQTCVICFHEPQTGSMEVFLNYLVSLTPEEREFFHLIYLAASAVGNKSFTFEWIQEAIRHPHKNSILKALLFLKSAKFTQIDLSVFISPEHQSLFDQNNDDIWSELPVRLWTPQRWDDLLELSRGENAGIAIREYVAPLIQYAQISMQIQWGLRKIDASLSRETISTLFYDKLIFNRVYSEPEADEIFALGSAEEIYSGIKDYCVGQKSPQSPYGNVATKFKVIETGMIGKQQKSFSFFYKLTAILGVIFFPTLLITIPICIAGYFSTKRKVSELESKWSFIQSRLAILSPALESLKGGRPPYLIGRDFLVNDDLEHAHAFLSRVSSKNENYARAMFECNRIERKRGNEKAAQLFLAKAKRKAIHDGMKNYAQATKALAEGRSETAFFLFSHVPEGDNDEYRSAMYECGCMKNSNKEYREAADFFEKAGQPEFAEIVRAAVETPHRNVREAVAASSSEVSSEAESSTNSNTNSKSSNESDYGSTGGHSPTMFRSGDVTAVAASTNPASTYSTPAP